VGLGNHFDSNRPADLYKRYRFPPAIIRYEVWLWHRFRLSHRDIEDLLAERGDFGASAPDSATPSSSK
jgi:transposase-like protein